MGDQPLPTRLVNHLRLVCAAMLMLSTVTHAQQWETLTSFRTANQLLAAGSDLLAATTGGLLVVSESDQSVRQRTNLDGLGTTRLFDITADASDRVWIAAAGRLISIDNDIPRQFLFRNQENELFDCVALADDLEQLWVGTTQGLVLFDKVTDNGQIADSYELFGTLNPAPRVSALALGRDSIWLATSAGIAVANRTNPLLLNGPSSWQSYNLSNSPELITDTMTAIALIDTLVYAGNSRGLFRLVRTSADTSFGAVAQFSGNRVYRLQAEGDSLLVCAANGLWVLRAGTVSQLLTPGYAGAVAATAVVAGRRWIATPSQGLWHEAGGSYEPFEETGLPQNDVIDVAIRSDRTLGILFRFQGTAIQNGSGWDSVAVAPFTRHTAMVADSQNNFWIGTFGEGVFRVSGLTATRYDSTNSPLRGNTDGGNNNFVVSYSLATDGIHLLAGAYRSFTGNPLCGVPLAVIDSPARWFAYGTADGLVNDRVVAVDFRDQFVAAGTEENGVFLCLVGQNLSSKSDDSACLQLRESNSNLRSDEVTAVAFSPSGELWVATNFGLSRLDPTIERRFTDVNLPVGFGPGITDLVFDTRGNLWLSSATGIARFDAVTAEVTTYRAESSGLIDDLVGRLTIDPFTNDLYCSTENGVSILRSTLGDLTPDPNQVLAFPNPYVVSGSADRLEFNFSGTGKVDIFTVDGRRVFSSAQLFWDGQTDEGEPASSGVYLFTITSSDGSIGRGKLVLIRK